ncbi:hypothetical protein C8F04DRAFT_1394021 [Mycena alexandri]|uniref:Uncharacterized protein n=1 Tax=Mycena alexandri TaxID=1745969 RepID=A0AAD6SZ47_9AGAR|nr:hypothetical protein C8F04DRAFT_1394021 [Mycena alexandri]
MEDFPITEAQIVASFMESVFWGIYLITFFLCMRVLVFRPDFGLKRLSELNWPMLLVALAMCSFATLDVAVGLMHNIQAFVLYRGAKGAVGVFSDISNWVNVVKTVDVVMQTTLGDGLLIYRCWVVYGRSWRIVAFPILLWIGGAVCTVTNIVLEARLHSDALVTSKSLRPVIISFWVLTIVLNILTTGMLVFRIWKVDRESARFAYRTASSSGITTRPSRLKQAMRIIVESGLLYTTVALITFITYITNSNSAYATSDVEVQIVGIAFNLIIIRADNRAAEEQAMLNVSNHYPLHVVRGGMAPVVVDGVHVTVTRGFDNAMPTEGEKDRHSLGQKMSDV